MVTDHLSYLGVCFTRNSKNLFKSNFLKLLDQAKQILSMWSPLSFSLIGRINSIKMTLLPNFLYLFQCLPIFLPKSFFQALDSLMINNIWNGKQPRLRKAFLQRPKQTGGMALPSFQYYYWAANIPSLVFWVHFHLDDSAPFWVTMESSAISPLSLSALLSAALPLSSAIPNSGPVIKHSLRIWTQFRKNFGLQNLSLFSPIAGNHLFAPSTEDGAFKIWLKKGLKYICDLFINDLFASFSQLTKKSVKCFFPIYANQAFYTEVNSPISL